jgi:hypothetical protein
LDSVGETVFEMPCNIDPRLVSLYTVYAALAYRVDADMQEGIDWRFDLDTFVFFEETVKCAEFRD